MALGFILEDKVNQISLKRMSANCFYVDSLNRAAHTLKASRQSTKERKKKSKILP